MLQGYHLHFNSHITRLLCIGALQLQSTAAAETRTLKAQLTAAQLSAAKHRFSATTAQQRYSIITPLHQSSVEAIDESSSGMARSCTHTEIVAVQCTHVITAAQCACM
jgi:hypothetical protein